MFVWIIKINQYYWEPCWWKRFWRPAFMVYLIGASSLNATIKRVPYKFRSELVGRKYSLGGLSFNENANNPLKVLKTLLRGQGILARKHKVIIWHDVISILINKHKNNNYGAISVEKLLEILREFSNLIEAVVYCRTEGSPDIFANCWRANLTY